MEYNEEEEFQFPEEITDVKLEMIYVGLLLCSPRAIARFFYLYEDCHFSDKMVDNSYRSVLFREGDEFSSELARKDFKLPKTIDGEYEFKENLKKLAKQEKQTIEKVYIKLKKLFMLKKYYLTAPTAKIQQEIVDIKKYARYDEMTVDEVVGTIDQITVTSGLSRGILNKGATNFLVSGDNTLTSGLDMPFPVLSTTFKGLRKGETTAFAMPSNYGKSRFTINMLAHIAFVKKEKVLMISNEMTEEKMKLCLITTIINNKNIQQFHMQNLSVDEGRLLDLKFKPDDKKFKEVDEKGFVLKYEEEDTNTFVKRLYKLSTEFRNTIKATKWLDTQVKNAIYFIHVAEHTNDELRKIILNYYYKEGIEYVFYDTLKTDIDNIGNGEELKKTATVLSTLAQKYKICIVSTLQLLESSTPPLHLNVNDLSVSKTVKEVLDNLCLVKQISKEDIGKYEFAENEESQDYKNLDDYTDPNIRYYVFVVDKNRAGSKPKLLFKLNLAYNHWEELGVIRMKTM